jgi:hypothetical protein
MYYDSFPIANIVKWSHRNLDSLNCQTMKVKPYIILNTSSSLFNYFNNIVPISIEYILFGCKEISEEFNTLFFKSVQKLVNCQTMKVKPYIILNTSKKHVNYEEDKNKVPMNKPYNIQNKNICNGIFHISFLQVNSIFLILYIFYKQYH